MKAATGGDAYNKFGHWGWTDSGMGTQVTIVTANVLGTERMLRLSSTLVLIVFLNLAVTVLAADTYSRNDFPTGFIFGAGTSAYQVEGAVNEDGRTPSIWDTFVHQGAMHGDTGDVAVDGYHKYKEDVQLMAETGLDAYRFSISWSRLIPNGRGPVNPKGLEYYNNLIDELIRHGVQPHVTLYNYDLPQALEDEYGGWISRKIVRDFTAFADVCFREFGDRVSYWTTINEPNIMSIGGYDQGLVPPMHCSAPFGVVNCTKGNSSSEPYLVMHHALLTHASTARLYREKYQGKKHGSIGLTLYAFGFLPLTNSTDDVVATQRAKDFYLGWALNPLVFGDYPKSMKENVGSRLPAFTKDESLLVKGSFDFIGLIHYASLYIKDDIDSRKLKIRDFGADAGATMILYPDTLSAFSLPCTTWGLPIVLELLQHAYGNPPVFIHENGVPTPRNSSLEDTKRVKCLHAFIGGVLDAIRNGSNARGYFIWSFMDVFELLDGWDTSYGLYYVDLQDPDLKRYPKLSAHWYSLLLRGQSIGPDGITDLEKNSSKTSHPSLASSA